jgi:hypothetical protein
LALPPQENEAFLREVDEELRIDQLTGFWKRWGRWLIGAVIGGLALFAGWLWWQSHRAEAAGLHAEQLDKALASASDGKFDDAKKQLDGLKAEGGDGYSASAQLTKAAIALEQRDLKGAATIFGSVAADTSIAQPWRDLALVRQTAVEFDTMKPEAVVARLKPLAVKGNPWFGSAGELTAIAYLKLGKPELAGRVFGDMAKDETVPETIRSRAVKMAGVLGVDVVEATSEVKSK